MRKEKEENDPTFKKIPGCSFLCSMLFKLCLMERIVYLEGGGDREELVSSRMTIAVDVFCFV